MLGLGPNCFFCFSRYFPLNVNILYCKFSLKFPFLIFRIDFALYIIILIIIHDKSLYLFFSSGMFFGYVFSPPERYDKLQEPGVVIIATM
jgi:hypothetical protein